MIRRLAREDRSAVVELCGRVFREDFVPLYFDSFICEKIGLGFEEKGRLCGIVFASRTLDGEGWLFGLRVDPDSRRRGIGRALTLRAMEKLASSCRIVRIGIFPENAPSLALAASLGFSLRAQYAFYEWKGAPPAAAPGNLEPVGAGDLDCVFAELSEDPLLRANDLLLPYRYEWFKLTKASLGSLLEKGVVWRFKEEHAIAGANEGPEPDVEITYLSGVSILPALFYHFAKKGPIEALLPADPALAQTLAAYGFTPPSWGTGMTILERELPFRERDGIR